MALEASGFEERPTAHRPRLLSYNGSSYIAGDLAEWLDDQGIGHVRGASNQQQIEGNIGDFISHYNHHRYREGLGNLRPADVFSGSGRIIPINREAIKQRTFEQRRLRHARRAA